MTSQEYYDLLVKSARDGTFPSGNEYDCLYRADGTAACKQRCAAGLLIPDDQYSPAMERRLCDRHPIMGVMVIPDGMTIGDIRGVQKAHDTFVRFGWSSSDFISRINVLDCFANVKRDNNAGPTEDAQSGCAEQPTQPAV